MLGIPQPKYPNLEIIYRNMSSLLCVLARRGVEQKFPDFDKGLKLAAKLLEDEMRSAFMIKKREYIVKVTLADKPDVLFHECKITTHRSMIEALEAWVVDNPEYQDETKYRWTCWMEVENAETECPKTS